jgi:hypothetical protein
MGKERVRMAPYVYVCDLVFANMAEIACKMGHFG